MIFVDTGIWYAANVMEEPEHQQADALLAVPDARQMFTHNFPEKARLIRKLRNQQIS
jgi:predicted nucleic acid-binding protein